MMNLLLFVGMFAAITLVFGLTVTYVFMIEARKTRKIIQRRMDRFILNKN